MLFFLFKKNYIFLFFIFSKKSIKINNLNFKNKLILEKNKKKNKHHLSFFFLFNQKTNNTLVSLPQVKVQRIQSRVIVKYF